MKSILLATAATLSLAGAALAQTAVAPSASAGVNAAVSAGVATPTASPMGATAGAMATTATPGATTAATTGSASFTDEEVAKVAAIAAETRRLNEAGQARIAAAATPEAKAAATAELQTSLRGAVTTQGITVERYNDLARAAATDPALMARLSSATAAQGTASAASTTAPDNPSQ